MNASIVVAVICLAILALARVSIGMVALASGRGSPISVLWAPAVASFIMVGIVVRLRLAWQWGRLAGLVGAVVLALLAAVPLREAKEHPRLLLGAVFVVMQAVPLLSMFLALSTKQARKYFGLTCPQCGSGKTRAGDFLFTKAVCCECGTSWS
jgi:hypothetical protein